MLSDRRVAVPWICSAIGGHIAGSALAKPCWYQFAVQQVLCHWLSGRQAQRGRCGWAQRRGLNIPAAHLRSV